MQKNNYIAVVGGVNVDIGGRPYQPLQRRDSNPGKIHISLGGVGRNIAHNLRLLGERQVYLLTAFGDDAFALKIEHSCKEIGIDISRARLIAGGKTSTYIYLCNEEGEMEIALSDMDICREINPAYLTSQEALLNGARLVVIDGNLSQDALLWLAKHCEAPIFADPVSAAKAEKLLPILGKIHTLKPNRLEAEVLSGVRIEDEESLNRAAEILLEKGVKRVFISLGSEGVFAAEGEQRVRAVGQPICLKNSSGAGDAFMAALVRSFPETEDLKACAEQAAMAAAIAVESEETVNPALSTELLRVRMENL